MRKIRKTATNHKRGEGMIIAVDFDGTLCEHKFPEIGIAYQDRINLLAEMKKAGNKIILSTCRKTYENRDVLKEAVDWCEVRGLTFDAINEDIESVKNSSFGRSKSNKIYADIYIDDRNVTCEWFNYGILKIEATKEEKA